MNIQGLLLWGLASICLLLDEGSAFLLRLEPAASRSSPCKSFVLIEPKKRQSEVRSTRPGEAKASRNSSRRPWSRTKVRILESRSKRQQQEVTIEEPEVFALFGTDAFAENPIGLEDKRLDALSRISRNLNVLSRILTTWSRSAVEDADERCYRVLERLRKGDENREFRVNRSVYYAVITAFARRGKIQRAEQLREEMTQYGLSPNGATYVTLWDAYINSSRLEEAEATIHELVDNPGAFATPSQIIGMFTKTIGAWAQSEASFAPDECRRLLCDLRQLGYSVGDPAIRPSIATYTAVINAHAKRRRATDAEAILSEMLRESEPLEPNIVPFNAMMSGWAKSNAPDGAERCKDWFERLKTMSASNPLLRPNAITYSALIEAYSRRKQPSAAESYLTEMVGEARLHPRTILPFSMVMNAYAKSDDPNGAAECCRVMEQLRKLAQDTGNKRLLPNLVAYTTTIDAFARRGQAMSAERQLRELLEGKSISDLTVVPFNSCLNAWAKSKTADAPEQCQRLLSEIKELSKEHASIRPNAATYTCVLEACRKGGRGEEAEEVLNQLLEEIPPNKDSFRPFCMTLNAWANSNSTEAPFECRRLLNKIIELSEHSKFYEPNAVTYLIVINAFAKRGMAEEAEKLLLEMILRMQSYLQPIDVNPFNSVLSGWAKSKAEDAPERCQQILSLMEQHQLSPDFVTYSTLLDVYARRGMAEEAESVLRRLQRHPSIQPNAISYNAVLFAWANSNATDAEDQHQRVLDEMQRELAKGDEHFVADVASDSFFTKLNLDAGH